MRILKRAVVGAAALALLTACASASPPKRSDPPTQTYAPIANLTRTTALNADSRFGADLLALVGKPTDNVVLSPYSIAVALQMALEGAKGETAEQMAKVLHIPGVAPEQLAATAATLRRDLSALDDPRQQVTMRIVNRMWPQAGFPIKPPYTASLRDGFGVDVQQVDFANDPPGARKTINQAVSDETNGKIPELLSADLDPMTRLVLTNAIYLKAGWTSPFRAADTRPDTFHRADGTSAEAPFMHQVGELDYAKRDGYQLVRLPYGSGDLAMTLIVPDVALAPVERILQQKGLAAVLGGPLEPAEVTLALPRFKIRTQAELVDTLKQLGMTDAFEDGAADFHGIADADLFISQVAHEADISVDEEGTEAAAATAVVIAESAGRVITAKATVTADRPFLFAITDMKTGTPLFLGRVADPTK